LHIYLEQWHVEDPKEPIKTAVHNYFAHRAELTDLEFKRLLEQVGKERIDSGHVANSGDFSVQRQ
jgi:hypothetical protein